MGGEGVLEPRALRIVVESFVIHCRIGVKAAERAAPQRLRLGLTLEIVPRLPENDDPAGIVDYGLLVERIRAACAERELRLLESLSRRIAEACFHDPGVKRLRLRVQKLDRFADIGAIGIESEWDRGSLAE